jgi:hypothetical protein
MQKIVRPNKTTCAIGWLAINLRTRLENNEATSSLAVAAGTRPIAKSKSQMGCPVSVITPNVAPHLPPPAAEAERRNEHTSSLGAPSGKRGRRLGGGRMVR